jgi:hypothetical protein
MPSSGDFKEHGISENCVIHFNTLNMLWNRFGKVYLHMMMSVTAKAYAIEKQNRAIT